MSQLLIQQYLNELHDLRKVSNDHDCVAFLFELHQQLASPLEAKKAKRRKRGG